MELTKKFELELSNLNQAVDTFNNAVHLTDQAFDDLTNDLIKNGKIQKFEYCTELAWKVSKMYLEIKTGEIAIAPKQVYKTMFISNLIDEDLYKAIFQTIEDRNRLSHIYKEEMYDVVYNNLLSHLNALEGLTEILNDKT